MALTPGQKKCIETLNEPLVVSAGAGSGKTFTLTKRIVNALAKGAVCDIDEVMAITFTSKAAGEIRSRVKGALRAEGLVDQALRVDNAWISTIHGMCARILRMHAVELGIDPSFSVLGQDAREALLDDAIDEALRIAKSQEDNTRFLALFDEYKARSAGAFDGGVNVDRCVRALVEKASAHPDGFDSIVLPPQGQSAAKTLVHIVELSNDMLIRAQAQKQSQRSMSFISATTDAQQIAQGLMDKPDLDELDVLNALNNFIMPGVGFGDTEYREYVRQEAKPAYSECALEAICGMARFHLETMVSIARDAYRLFNDAKAELGVLDNNDLLVYAHRALVYHPDITREYENRFKLIMIDEFQDTDQLQIDMILRLAGPRAERLCVVGDAQQSIYRFRGADVSVYRKYLESIRRQNPESIILLPDNFRSSKDILAFVDRIFEQQEVFGSEFMSLACSRDEKRVKVPYKANDHRIEIQHCVKPHHGCEINQTAYAAQCIAERFSELRNQGHSAGDMVILLGGMPKAGIYAEALRNAGFSCVIAGGSVFNQEPEVKTMVNLAQMIANPCDTETLFKVLSSDMFSLSADDLVRLSTRHTEDGVFKDAINYGITSLYRDAMKGALEGVSVVLEHAVYVVARAIYAAGKKPLSEIMRTFVCEAGYLRALESRGAEGQAIAGNVLKVIRLCRQFEQESSGSASSIAAQLRDYVACAKEAPGALSVRGNDSVRIMTVHASKGLEFPIVAVAEMSKPHKAQGFVAETINGKSYVSLTLSNTLSEAPKTSLLKNVEADAILGEEDNAFEVLTTTNSPALFRVALADYNRQEEDAEAQRLLYVALTRAKEALIVSMYGTATKEAPNGIKSGLYADIQSALCGLDGEFEYGVSYYPYGGAINARVNVVNLMAVQNEMKACEQKEQEALAGELSDTLSNNDEKALDQILLADGGMANNVGVDKFEQQRKLVAQWELLDSDPIIKDYSELVVQGPSLHCKELGSSGKMAHVFSYSSLSQEGLECDTTDKCIEVIGATNQYIDDYNTPEVDSLDEDALAWQRIRRNLSDTDKATDFGTAVHRLCQLAVLQREGNTAPLAKPSNDRIDAVMKAFAVSPTQKKRLERALDIWFESTLAQRVSAFDDLRAEQPFFVRITNQDVIGSEVFLEGEIDLLALRKANMDSALIVDYKTGGSAFETEDALKKKHLLQSYCYAYTVLRKGYHAVDVVFVRVEQCAVSEARDGREPQYVHYHYIADDIAELEECIVSLYKE